MTPLIHAQLVSCSILLILFACVLQFRLIEKAFSSLNLEHNHVQALRVLVIIILICLSYILLRDTWTVLK